ncbi:MAG: hypothetical protein FJ029_03815 [Actinobacteria bacterium]|nr:hypothetical protein [Actinomycetota bacterium]
MLIYQWSAIPRQDCWSSARRLIHTFVQVSGVALDWPSGTVMVTGREAVARTLSVEFAFDGVKAFEAAWQRLLAHEATGELWARLQPLLEADSVRRSVYDVQYSRAGRLET